MSNKLYIVRTHAINLTNLALALILTSEQFKLYYPCEYQITDGKFFNVIPGKFVKDAVASNPNVTFRNINWQQNVSYLDSCLSKRSVAFGTHRDDQILWLKENYGENAITIGVSYTEFEYPMMLKNLSEYHIHLLQTGHLDMNYKDREQISQLSNIQLIEYYMELFDSMNLIPRTSQPVCDINIPVIDFTNLKIMQAHYNKMSVAFNNSTLTLYQSWLDNIS